MYSSDFTNINSLGIVFICSLTFLILFLPRHYAILPIIGGLCYVGSGQVLDIFGLHFTILRILILVGWIRVIARREIYIKPLNEIDKSVILFIVVSFIAFMCLWQTKDALINRLGYTYNVIGLYFLYRMLVRNTDEIVGVMQIMSFAIMPLAVLMILEKFTGRNIFSYFGGVPEFTVIREGRLRCQGPFAHPILSGTFGVTFVPMFVGLWFKGQGSRIISIVGFISATLIMVLSSSSGPLLAYLSVFIGFYFWQHRKNMKSVRWILVVLILCLHIIMKAPVWALIGKISGPIGGTGWHRVMLIDSAVKYFHEWWLFGTINTAKWMPYVMPSDPNNVDITNQYIGVGIQGGILSLILFISIIVKSFRKVGTDVNSLEDQSSWKLKFTWSLGVSLLMYVVSFISVAMFDFIIVYFYMIISFISVSLSCSINYSKVNNLQIA